MLTSYGEPMVKHLTTTRTIRIETDLDKTLAEIAAEERISVNSLINNALRKFSEWDVFAIKFGVITNFTVTARRFIDCLSDDKVRELGKWIGENEFKEFIIFWRKSLDVEGALKAIRILGSTGNYLYEEYVNNGHRIIVCKHDLGAKWSLYYESMFKSLFEKSLGIQVATDRTEDQIVLNIPIRTDRFNESYSGWPLK